MTTEKPDTQIDRKSATPTHLDKASHTVHATHTRGEAFARRAKSFLSELPTNLDEQIKRNPYRALGIACAVGVGAGVVLSSRILRTALASAASLAIIELGRNYWLRGVEQEFGTHPGKSAAAKSS